MSALPLEQDAAATTQDDRFGLARSTADGLRRVFETTPNLATVWVYGSRARGDAKLASDIDLAVDAPALSDDDFAALQRRLLDLPILHRVDVLHWQRVTEPLLRSEIERDRRVMWQRRLPAAEAPAVGAVTLKRFQSEALGTLAHYLDELRRHAQQARKAVESLGAMEGMEDAARQAADFPAQTWKALARQQRLPPSSAQRAHSSRWDGTGEAIPNVCLKVPTGGGKTLLAAAAVGSICTQYLKRHTGLVLWVVPNEAIYRQTLKALNNRDHPYRQMLTVAGAGRVKLLEKNSPLSQLDVNSHLCVMLLMLQSAARQSKETLRFFRDRGNVVGFLPPEDDFHAHAELLRSVPNLDAYGDGDSRQLGAIVKSSLGNVMRLARPLVVIDEGHHAYSETALKTIDGFNPGFMLELSATPRVAAKGSSGSNVLIDVRGADLDEAEMIKLPIDVDVRHRPDWQSCLAASLQRLDELQREAEALRADTARYIRPILLVQVERTGADLQDAGFIHAEHAKAHLLQLGLQERQIAIKTSDRDDLKAPENIDLLAESCEVRVIITKQALQEGWDCPFAYVLCALAAGRNLAAMTQLVGRILRMPHVAKTGRAALDACYVVCHDARTGDVVKAIKKSLEGEGMGDLGVTVRADPDDPQAPQPVTLQRRPAFAGLRLFVPTVTWCDSDGARRPLDYDSDVLGALPWHEIRGEAFAHDWAPDANVAAGSRFTVGLELLAGASWAGKGDHTAEPRRLDRARLVRSLIDLAPNAWLVWDWVSAAVASLLARGHAESSLAASMGSLVERLRADVEAARDALAQKVFEQLLAQQRIEFALRADAHDFVLPEMTTHLVQGKPQWQLRDDGRPIEKSLLEPALKWPDLNDLEVRVAGYLDQQAAVRWWHRNVARTQVGLQGWKRHKVYPDFVFAYDAGTEGARMVLLETKGLHLQGQDTQYKQALLHRLSEAFRDERGTRIGSLELATGHAERVVCDLVFDEAWQGALAARYFNRPSTAAPTGAAPDSTAAPARRSRSARGLP
jgi:type III restriction enzyme